MTPKPKKSAERELTYARGGAGHMMPKQAANPQKPGGTAHNVKGAAPGAKSAKGGPPTRGVSVAVPAAPGKTAPASRAKSC